MSVGTVLDLGIRCWSGKFQSELAMLRDMIAGLDTGDVLLTDRYLCSYMEIALLELRGSQLAALSEAILQRDEARLQGLFEEMEQTQQTQAETDNKLLGLRKALGDILVCPLEQVTLTWVIKRGVRRRRTPPLGPRPSRALAPLMPSRSAQD